MGLVRGPAWRRVARRRRRIEGAQPRAPGSRSAGGCHAAPAPDTDRTCEAASCHAWGVRVHVTCAPAPPAGRHTCRWCEKCAPDGVSAWVFAGRRKRPPVRGALLELLGSTRLFMRGPSPPPRRAKGVPGAGAVLASCAHEARRKALRQVLGIVRLCKAGRVEGRLIQLRDLGSYCSGRSRGSAVRTSPLASRPGWYLG